MFITARLYAWARQILPRRVILGWSSAGIRAPADWQPDLDSAARRQRKEAQALHARDLAPGIIRTPMHPPETHKALDEEAIFDIVGQLNRGAALVASSLRT